MGKTFEALERYRQENTPFAAAGHPRQGKWDKRPLDLVRPDGTPADILMRRNRSAPATDGEQVSLREKRLLNAHWSESKSASHAAGSSSNKELTLVQPDDCYHPPLPRTVGWSDRHHQGRRTKWVERPTGRLQRTRLETSFAKQIVLNLKSGIIQSIIKYKYFLVLLDYLRYTDGELIKSANHGYYRLNFKSKARLPILADRTGNLKCFFPQNGSSAAGQSKPAVAFNLIDPDAIRPMELNLICNIFKTIPPYAIKRSLMGIFDLTIDDPIECKGGRIVPLNGNVAYELWIDIRLRFSIFMDVHGNLVDVTDNDSELAQEVLCDHSILQGWVPQVNLFENRKPEFSTLPYPAYRY